MVATEERKIADRKSAVKKQEAADKKAPASAEKWSDHRIVGYEHKRNNGDKGGKSYEWRMAVMCGVVKRVRQFLFWAAALQRLFGLKKFTGEDIRHSTCTYKTKESIDWIEYKKLKKPLQTLYEYISHEIINRTYSERDELLFLQPRHRKQSCLP